MKNEFIIFTFILSIILIEFRSFFFQLILEVNTS